jgi:hypothetical protein
MKIPFAAVHESAIGPSGTLRNVRLMGAFGYKADVPHQPQTSPSKPASRLYRFFPALRFLFE